MRVRRVMEIIYICSSYESVSVGLIAYVQLNLKNIYPKQSFFFYVSEHKRLNTLGQSVKPFPVTTVFSSLLTDHTHLTARK